MIPRRVGNFVEPLSDIADEFLAHLESIKDKFGNVDDIRPELSKWSFQGSKYQVIRGAGLHRSKTMIIMKERGSMITSVSWCRSQPPVIRHIWGRHGGLLCFGRTPGG